MDSQFVAFLGISILVIITTGPDMALMMKNALSGRGHGIVMLVLGAGFCLMAVVWLLVYAAVIARAGDFLRRSRVRRTIEGLTGVVFAALGARPAAEHH